MKSVRMKRKDVHQKNQLFKVSVGIQSVVWLSYLIISLRFGDDSYEHHIYYFLALQSVALLC